MRVRQGIWARLTIILSISPHLSRTATRHMAIFRTPIPFLRTNARITAIIRAADVVSSHPLFFTKATATTTMIRATSLPSVGNWATTTALISASP